MKSRVDALAYLHKIFDELRQFNEKHSPDSPSDELTGLISGELSLEAYLERRFDRYAAELAPALDDHDLSYVRQTCLRFARNQVLSGGSLKILRDSLPTEGDMSHKKERTLKDAAS